MIRPDQLDIMFCEFFIMLAPLVTSNLGIRGDGIQRLLMEGRINGRRGRGRPRTMWTDNIKEWTKMSYNDCIRVAQDRERWRSMTAGPVDYRWHIMMMMNFSSKKSL